ncbi:hypothetical protein EJB05_34923 [Eragrostis curvula]|uniref:Uncharacterized protein n=1 Tax=Eragrostis curvula TaxID=38414 RepID=A0A5J9U572_9POAL|nr:hypothetical protein EJB05_34899 [Eragrostis curvula]TVU18809.1 hypothetical protein EJB05_34923 [Eragrostis curvula]
MSHPVLSATTSSKKRVAPSTSDLLPMDSQLSSSRVVRQRMCIDAAPTESCPPKPTLPSRGRPKCRLLESTSDFPTDFQFSRTHRVRSQQLRKPSELSQPVLPATTSNKKRVAPNTSDSLPIDSQPSSSRVVQQRMSMNAAPTETGQPDPTFPSGGRPKRKLLESTSDFPTDFQFSCSRRVRSQQLRKPSDYPWSDTPAAQEGEGHQSYIPTTCGAGSASVSGTHKHKMMMFDAKDMTIIFNTKYMLLIFDEKNILIAFDVKDMLIIVDAKDMLKIFVVNELLKIFDSKEQDINQCPTWVMAQRSPRRVGYLQLNKLHDDCFNRMSSGVLRTMTCHY